MPPSYREERVRRVKSETTILEPASRPAILDKRDQVLLWRIAQLDRAGYNGECAVELAMASNVDLHIATDLLEHGCPVETATRILL